MSTTSRGAALPQNGMKLLGHAAANSLEMFTNTGEYTRATQKSQAFDRATPPNYNTGQDASGTQTLIQ